MRRLARTDLMRKLAIGAAAALTTLAMGLAGGPAQATTRGRPDGQASAASYPYRLVDPGTFGGPQSFFNLPAVPLTKQGGLLGSADTTIPDADYPNFNPFLVGFPDPWLVHAFEWKDGQLTDLGALPGNNGSSVFEVNGNGVGVGASETATTDPHTGWPSLSRTSPSIT